MIPSDPFHDPEPGEQARAVIQLLVLVNFGIYAFIAHLLGA